MDALLTGIYSGSEDDEDSALAHIPGSLRPMLQMMITESPGNDSFMCKLLEGFGEVATSTADGSSTRSTTDPQPKCCTQNALDYATEQGHAAIWCGYACSPKSPLYVGHCWNVDPDSGAIVDVTPGWSSGSAYYGIPCPLVVAKMIWAAAHHGNELMDSWRSACQQSPGCILAWKRAILETLAPQAQLDLEEALRLMSLRNRYSRLCIQGVSVLLRWSSVPRRTASDIAAQPPTDCLDIDIVQISVDVCRRYKATWFVYLLTKLSYQVHGRGVFIEQTITPESRKWAGFLSGQGVIAPARLEDNYLVRLPEEQCNVQQSKKAKMSLVQDWRLYVTRRTFHGDHDKTGTVEEGFLTIPAALKEFKRFVLSHDHLRLEYSHLECGGDAFTLLDYPQVDHENNHHEANLYDRLCYEKLLQGEHTECSLCIRFHDI